MLIFNIVYKWLIAITRMFADGEVHMLMQNWYRDRLQNFEPGWTGEMIISFLSILIWPEP